MADTFPKDQGRTSFAHARRADLPGRDGEDDRAASAAQAAFERARIREAGPRGNDAPNDNDAASVGDRPARANAFVFPDPHPSFAHPTRLPDAELFRVGANDVPGDRMDKRAFVAMRRAAPDREYEQGRPQRRER